MQGCSSSVWVIPRTLVLGDVFFLIRSRSLCWVYLVLFWLTSVSLKKAALIGLYSRAPCAGFSSRLDIFPSVGDKGDMKVSIVGVKSSRILVLGEVCFLFVGVRCAQCIWLIMFLTLMCSSKTF